MRLACLRFFVWLSGSVSGDAPRFGGASFVDHHLRPTLGVPLLCLPRAPLPVVSSPWCCCPPHWPGPCVVWVVCVARKEAGVGGSRARKFPSCCSPPPKKRAPLELGDIVICACPSPNAKLPLPPCLHHNTFIARRRPSLAPYHCCILHFLLARRPRHSRLDSHSRSTTVRHPPRSIGHPCVHGLISPTGTVAMRFEI